MDGRGAGEPNTATDSGNHSINIYRALSLFRVFQTLSLSSDARSPPPARSQQTARTVVHTEAPRVLTGSRTLRDPAVTSARLASRLRAFEPRSSRSPALQPAFAMATAQATKNNITLKGSTAIVTEFFGYAVNSARCTRAALPLSETFERKQKYGLGDARHHGREP